MRRLFYSFLAVTSMFVFAFGIAKMIDYVVSNFDRTDAVFIIIAPMFLVMWAVAYVVGKG